MSKDIMHLEYGLIGGYVIATNEPTELEDNDSMSDSARENEHLAINEAICQWLDAIAELYYK